MNVDNKVTLEKKVGNLNKVSVLLMDKLQGVSWHRNGLKQYKALLTDGIPYPRVYQISLSPIQNAITNSSIQNYINPINPTFSFFTSTPTLTNRSTDDWRQPRINSIISFCTNLTLNPPTATSTWNQSPAIIYSRTFNRIRITTPTTNNSTTSNNFATINRTPNSNTTWNSFSTNSTTYWTPYFYTRKYPANWTTNIFYLSVSHCNSDQIKDWKGIGWAVPWSCSEPLG